MKMLLQEVMISVGSDKADDLCSMCWRGENPVTSSNFSIQSECLVLTMILRVSYNILVLLRRVNDDGCLKTESLTSDLGLGMGNPQSAFEPIQCHTNINIIEGRVQRYS